MNKRNRIIHPFFSDAINQAYLRPEKQIYLMDGCVATGKSNNFTFGGPYSMAQDVVPIPKGGQMVRESLWAAIRESENSSVATIMEILYDSVFPPEVIDSPDGPVSKVGSHPTHIIIEHGLPDGTVLKMDIECHGFNNEQAENRLRSRSYVGCIIPEVQGIPWSIVEVARQRSGRWRPGSVRMERTIEGVKYSLSGARQLKLVFADANIPKRPHKMYEVLYDANLSEKQSVYMVLTVPCPIIPVETSDISDKTVLEKYPITTYKKKKVVWIPDPECYYMTKHFEADQLDSKGERIFIDGVRQTIPWTGYEYWFGELMQPDSIITRHILGKPESIGGDSSVYKSFDKDNHIKDVAFRPYGDVYVGHDPGLYASWVFSQVLPDKKLHVFNEIIFEAQDGYSNKEQIKDFIIPYVNAELSNNKVIFVSDPSAQSGNASGVGAIKILKDNGLNVQLCKTPNQDTTSRRDCLGTFIAQGELTVSPSCVGVTEGLLGLYKYKTTRSGIISSTVDKNRASHTIEALQYSSINIYYMLEKAEKRKKRVQHGKRNLWKIQRAR